MSTGPTFAPDDDSLGPVIESFLVRLRRGERPAVTDLIARHPELAGPIRELVPALVELEQFGGMGGGRAASSRSRPDAGAATATGGGPPDRLGDYSILRTVGGGGMGVVYEAERESLKSRVALKVMSPRFRADPRFLMRFHAEARLAAGLHHTNIVSVFDFGEQDGVCYYAMPFIHGQPLDLVLDDIRRIRAEGSAPGGLAAVGAPAGATDGPEASIAVRGLFTGRFADPASTSAPASADAAVRGPADPMSTTRSGDAESASTIAVPEEPDADADADACGASGVPGPATPGSTALGGSPSPRYFREIARVAAQVADALEYAHRRGVLHRDIKPSNLLLDALGNVWVTDFGLAKLEGSDDLTQSRELVGTLRYMAPERLRGTSSRRGDIYSLGATLYELVTLRPPFEESDQIRLIERIREDAPPPPRQIDRQIPRDLETIVLKAMARDPKDRFGSAGELADELRRFVDGRPIRSRPVSVAEQFWRWCRRDPKLAGACAAAAVLTIALALGATAAAWLYHDQVVRIRRAETETRKALFESLAAQARGTRLSQRPGQRFEALAALREASALAHELGLPRSDFDRLRDEAIACLTLPDIEPSGRAIHRPDGVLAGAFDPAMTRYALRFRDGTVSVRDLADDRETARFRALGDREFWILEFSPDGRYLATDDVPSRDLRVWDLDRRSPVLTIPGPVVWKVSFHPDGRRILAGEGTLREYDLETGRLVRSYPGKLVRAAYSPDGALIAAVDAATTPPTCRILEAGSGRTVRSFPLRSSVSQIAWGPDGRTLATACDDGKVDLWDAATGIRRATTEGHDNGGLRVAFHPAGTLLASDGWEYRLRLWDATLGQPLLSLSGGSDVRFAPDGRLAVSLADELTPYRVEPAREYRTFAHAAREVMDYANPSIRRDGRILAVGSSHGVVLWDLADGRELAYLPIGLAWSTRFEPTGDLLTSGTLGVQRWPVRLDEARGELRIGPPRRLPLPASACVIDQDRSGRITALAAHRYAQVAMPGRTFRVGPLDDCRGVAISPDGLWLATGTHIASRGAQVWRIEDGARAADLPIEDYAGVVFTPDGSLLVTMSPRLRFWEVGTWREVEPNPVPVIGSLFSPDGRITIVVEPGRILRLVEFATGRTLARLESPDLCGVYGLAFAPDGSRLVVTTKDRPSPCVHVWDLRAIRAHLAGMGLDWDAPAFAGPAPAAAGRPLTVAVDMGAFRGLDEETWPLLRQARQLEQAGQSGEAIDAYRRAVARCANFAQAHNALAWMLATRPAPLRDPVEAVEHARRAVALAPEEAMYLNTYGIALYRAGRPAEAIPILERSLRTSQGQFDGFDLFFLAMAHHRLGDCDRARDAFDRALRWVRQREPFHTDHARELAAFRAEAEAVLAGPAGELPVDVFAPDAEVRPEGASGQRAPNVFSTPGSDRIGA